MEEEIVRVVECPHCGKSKTVTCPDHRTPVNAYAILPDHEAVPAPHRKTTEFCGKCGEYFSVCWYYSKI